MEGNKITIIIPCYCSEHYLKKTVSEILAVFSDLPGIDAGGASIACCPPSSIHGESYRPTIVLINDASPDRTDKVIRELVDAYPQTIIGIELKRNVGQARAKMAGLPYAQGTYTVFMDDDGQHDPRTIPELIQKVDCGFDLVYTRFPKLAESVPRKIASGILDSLLWLFCAKPRGLRITSYFALSPAAVERLLTYESPHPFIGGYLMSKHAAVDTVFSNHRVRHMGKSGYSLRKLCKRAAELCLLWRLPVTSEEAMYEIEAVYGTEYIADAQVLTICSSS